jgi:hypothetical protein
LEDVEFLKTWLDVETMEEAITKFMDGMEDQKLSGFKDMHNIL